MPNPHPYRQEPGPFDEIYEALIDFQLGRTDVDPFKTNTQEEYEEYLVWQRHVQPFRYWNNLHRLQRVPGAGAQTKKRTPAGTRVRPQANSKTTIQGVQK